MHELKANIDYYSPVYEASWQDYLFGDGHQWDEREVTRRGDSRPNLVINECKKYEKRIVNPYIKYPYKVEISAKNEKMKGLEPALQKILDDTVNSQNSRMAHQEAFKSGVRCGYSSVKVRNDYLDEKNDKQELVFDAPKDFRTTIRSRYSVEVDGSDNDFLACIEVLNRKKVEEKYGEDVAQSAYQWGIDLQLKCPEDSVSKVTMYWLEEFEKDRYFFPDGTYSDEEQDGYRSKRSITHKKLKVIELIGDWVLFKEEYNMNKIPEVPIYGMDRVIDEQWGKAGIVNEIRDINIVENYTFSSIAELVSNAPKAPIIADMKSVKKYKKYYEEANIKNHAVLYYDTYTENGKTVPPPSRMDNTAQTQGYEGLINNLSAKMTDTLGANDIIFGNTDDAKQSGKALNIRTLQAETSIADYNGNYQYSLKRLGAISLDFYLVINDGVVLVEPEGGEPFEANLLDQGISSEDFTFDLVNGPANESAKQDQLNLLATFASHSPNVIPNTIDILAELHGANPKLQNRLDKLVPPELKEDAMGDPEVIAQQLDQAMEMIEGLEQTIQLQDQEKNRLVIALQTELRNNEVQLQKQAMADQTKLTMKEMDLVNAEADRQSKEGIEEAKQSNENLRTVAELEEEQAKRLEDQVERQSDKDREFLKEVIDQNVNYGGNLGQKRL